MNMDDWKLKAKAVVKLVMKRDVYVSLLHLFRAVCVNTEKTAKDS